MVRLWVSGKECVVPQDLEIEFSYNTSDADGLETQCSHYTTTIDLPITAENIAIFTPLFDIHTLFGSASFDIHSNAPAIIEVAGQSARGYVKMESIDSEYHLRFIDGAGLLLEKLRGMKLSDLPDEVNILMPYAFNQSQFADDYASLYGSGTAKEYYVLFPAFSKDEEDFDEFKAGNKTNGDIVTGRFVYSYIDENGTSQTAFYTLNEHQARIYRKSHMRCAMQMRHMFQRIIAASGFTCTYMTDFFDSTNPYWKNLFMVMKQRFDVDSTNRYAPSAYMPDMSCEDFILGYCKMFGLRIVLDGTTVNFYTRREWYDIYKTVNITDGVDYKKGIVVSPNKYAENVYAAYLDCDGTPCGVNANKDGAVNLFDGVPFKYCEMMQYNGVAATGWEDYVTPGGSSRRVTNYTEVQFPLPFINSTEGGELLYRGDGLDPRPGGFWLMLDNIDAPSTELSVGQNLLPPAKWVSEGPNMFTKLDNFPLYAYKENQKYNYDYQTAFDVAQNNYAKFFADYVTEITSKDNAFIDVEGNFSPAALAQLAKCNTMVLLDNVRCRVIECVTNRIDRCKLTLQKISDKTKLIAGQLFIGYYLRTMGEIWVPDTDTIGTAYALPIQTNDSFGVSTADFTWSNTDPMAVKLAVTPSPSLVTFAGFSNVAYASWSWFTVYSTSGLTANVYYLEYFHDRVVSYGPNPSIDFVAETGTKRLRMAKKAGTGVLRIRQIYGGTLWTDTSYLALSISQQTGTLTIECKDASSLAAAAVCVCLESSDGTTMYARSEAIGIQIDPS